VFLSETRQQKDRVSNIRFRLQLSNCFIVDGQGKGGGLALYWSDLIKVDILSYGMHHIDTLIWDGNHHAAWRGTFIYGEPRAHDRHIMWELIRRIKPRSQAPWVMIGDFNEALWQSEHFSSTKRTEPHMRYFREILSHCDLHDLSYVGQPWTFSNKQAAGKNVKVRLDHAVASPSWMSWFPTASLWHISSSRSDHCPIFLDADDENKGMAHQHIDRYQMMWEREESLYDEVKNAWKETGAMQNLGHVRNSLKGVMTSLKRWSQAKFGVVSKEIKKIRKRMEELIVQNPSEDQPELNGLRERMDKLLHREEIMWLQRSRVSWLREGDRNTKYFHRKAVGRAKKNKIKSLRKTDGHITKQKVEMECMACNFFKELYRAAPMVQSQEVLDLVQPKITAEINEALCKDFWDKEIIDAMFQIGPLKAPCLDGFPARFFQRHWDTLKSDVISGVRKFFETGRLPPSVNETTIVLIPKRMSRKC
jgi:hypothetical protein